MSHSGISYRACTMTGLACSTSFLCLGAISYPINLDGVQSCYFIENFATFPCIGRHAWGVVSYIRWCMPRFTPIAVIFMCCTPSVRAGVLPPTPFTPYLERCPSPYGTYTNLAGFQSVARYMTRSSLASKLSSIGTSRIKNYPIFLQIPVPACRSLEKMPSCEKGVSGKV